MPAYYVNRNPQPTGEHEVHQHGVCPLPPRPENRDELGPHPNCWSALVAARAKGYNPVDGCAYCCPDCHAR